MAGRFLISLATFRKRYVSTLVLLATLSFRIATPVEAKIILSITSSPRGASVELDGIVVGKTPFEVEVPGGYLHGTKSVFGKVLDHQMHLKLTLEGYLPVNVDLANGPRPWVALNGTYHGDYWLLKSDHFSFTLEKAATNFAAVTAPPPSAKLNEPPPPDLPTEQVVSIANPSVLRLKTYEGSGSGFLITETGIAVTNAHVVGNEHELVADTAAGQGFQAKLLYVDPKLDVALVQLQGSGFPRLRIADSSGLRLGSAVIAIGSPSKGFPNSVTKGIVSAVGTMPNEAGTWIQTDASINPGNSGGPLLNGTGAVVGITTQKQFVSSDGRPLQGIGFALSSDDILGILRRLSPEAAAQVQIPSPPESKAGGSGLVKVSADIEDADIYLDGKFVGNAPSSLHVGSGGHRVEVKSADCQLWSRNLEITDGSEITLHAVLKPKSVKPQ